jgi:FKBP-type peptidyl-prolyl cis-trans isomerase FkpA
MKRTLALVCLSLLCAGCTAGTPAQTPEPKTEEEKAIYALGLGLSRQVVPFHLSEAEIEILKAGLADGALGRKAKVDMETYREKIAQMADARGAAAAVEHRKAGTAYLEKAAAEEGARKLPTGLVMKTLQEGSGKSPMLGDSVKVRYKGTLIDGTVFDSTSGEKEAATLPMGGVIPCWAQGLQLMKEGGKAKLVCPADLAYGDRGAPPTIQPGATLVFDVELVEIVK